MNMNLNQNNHNHESNDSRFNNSWTNSKIHSHLNSQVKSSTDKSAYDREEPDTDMFKTEKKPRKSEILELDSLSRNSIDSSRLDDRLDQFNLTTKSYNIYNSQSQIQSQNDLTRNSLSHTQLFKTQSQSHTQKQNN